MKNEGDIKRPNIYGDMFFFRVSFSKKSMMHYAKEAVITVAAINGDDAIALAQGQLAHSTTWFLQGVENLGKHPWAKRVV